MNNNYLFEKVHELKEKITNLFLHRKKLKALENYSQIPNFKHINYLPLIKQCMLEGFLEEQEASFLDHMLNKYEINYLDWSHRTKWLKNEMVRLSAPRKRPLFSQMDLFDASKKRSYNVPLELLSSAQNNRTGRAA